MQFQLRFLKFGCLVASLLWLGLASQAMAATYYVRATGNDTKNGLSPANAFRSISKAANVAKAGDTVWIGAGIYNNSIVPAYSGNAGNPIQFIADTWGVNTGDGGGVVVSGGSAELKVNGKNHIQFIAIQFGGGTVGYGGITVDEDDTTSGVDFIRFESCSGGLLKDCDIRYGDDALYIKNAEVTIDGTYIEDHSKNGVRIEGSSSRVTIQFCIIGLCGSRGIYVKDAQEVTVESSTIYNNGNHGIRIESDSSGDKFVAKRCLIYGNSDGVHIHGKSQITFENCLIRNNREDGIHAHNGSSAVSINHCTICRNNRDGVNGEGSVTSLKNSILAYNGDDGIDRNGGTLLNSYCCAYGNSSNNLEGTSAGTGTIQSDPKFASTSDYHLQLSSPCIDSGTGTVSEDLEMIARPVGPKVDMGCYESGGGGSGTGRQYYVRMNGSDRRDGLSPANAFRTIGRAISTVMAGDTVWVGAGTYYEAPDISNKTGTSTQTIKFTADTDGNKTGDAGAVVVQGGFYLQNSSYITVSLFTLPAGSRKASWSSYYVGAHLSGSSNCTLQNLVITGGSYGVLADNSPSSFATGCTVSGASTHGFCFQGTTTGSIQGCTSSSNSQAGYYVAQGTVAISGCTSSSNGAYGYRYNVGKGSISSSSSTSDYLAADLVGANNDRSSLVATNLTIQGSQQGAANLSVCTAQIVGGGAALCTGGTNGVYVDNANLTLSNATVSGLSYGLRVVNGGSAVLSGCTIANCSNDGVYGTAATMSVSNSTISNCRYGLRGETNSSLSAVSCTLSGHSSWAVNHAGTGTVNGCTLSDNYQGAYLSGQTNRGDITLVNLSISNSTREGLVAIRCTGNVLGGAQTLGGGGGYGVYSLDSNLTLSNFQVQGPDYGVTAYDSDLTISGGTITNCPYDGLYLSNCNTSVSNSTISTCRAGIQGANNGTLNATSCTLTNNSSWGIRHTGYGAITGCTVTNNANGLYLVGAATRGDITLNNTVVQGTTSDGLYLTRCTGTIPAGTANISQGGTYSAYLTDSDLTFTSPKIGGTQYGILAYSSTLQATGATVSGCQYDGIYGEGATITLSNSTFSNCRTGVYCPVTSTLNATSCTLTGSTAWAIRHSGYGTLTDCQITNNYQGVFLTGAAATGDINIQNMTIQGSTRDGLWATRCTGTVVGGPANLSSGGTYGVYLSASSLNLSNVKVSGAQYGVLGTSSTMNLTDATFTGCTDWGVYHQGYGTLTNCTVTNCTRGLYAVGQATPTDIQLVNATVQGSTSDGIVAIRCTGNLLAGSAPLSQGGSYGAYLSSANLSIDSPQISGSQRGIIAVQSTVSLQNPTITGTVLEGILGTGSNVTLSNGVISNCGTRGIDCQSGSTVNLTSTQITGCGDWGLVAAGYGTLTSCQLSNNAHGANLSGNTNRGDITFTDLTINDNSGEGLYATRCIGNVQGGTGDFSGSGTYGLYSNDSQLTVQNANMIGNTYGMYSSASDLTVQSVRIAGATTGIYSSADPALNLDRTRVESCTQWGLEKHQGGMRAINCLFANNANGVLLDATTQGDLWNTTAAGNAQYGVYQASGTADLRNTIITGTNQGTGIYRATGTLNMSHNLVYGFATSYTNVTPDENTQVKNPRFTDAGAGDYSLTKGSPAINGGTDLLGYVGNDIAGNSRPAFNVWDIGAHEFLQDNASLRVLQWDEQR